MDDEGESFDTAQKKQKITFIFISFSVWLSTLSFVEPKE